MEMQVVAALQGFDNELSLERCYYDAVQQLRFETHAPLQQLSPHPPRARLKPPTR